MKSNTHINVALVLGGISSEREVSQLSAKGVLQALKELGYKYKLIDPAFGIEQPDSEELFFSDDKPANIDSRNYLRAINSDLFDGIDIVFNALHGTWGEDGSIQSLLEFRGIKYTGSGILASSISMNKTFTKVMFNHYGVVTPDWLLFRKSISSYKEILSQINSKLPFPCVIKPNNQGSAIGLTICKSESDIEKAIELAGKYSDEVLIEKYIDGHELTVGILEGYAFPPLEIKPKHEFYDYDCKYTHGMSEYEVPANFPEEILNTLKEQAVFAYNSVGCSTYGRIDFRVNKNLDTYCLEVNTLPGLTSTSLLPKTAKADGLSYESLVDRIIRSSL